MGDSRTQSAFLIDPADNVATALTALEPGEVHIVGSAEGARAVAIEPIPSGHKLALRDIASGADVVKYGVRIGIATRDILAGSWVHLHVMRSACDDRSSHLDVVTGAPMDTRYQ